LLASVSDVTVTSTLNVTLLGEPVMVKLFVAVLEFTDVVKNVDEDPSCFADTSIFTPDGGIVDLMVTIKGKSGPGDGAWLLPDAGFNSTLSGVSLLPPPLLFLQLLPITRTATISTETRYRTFFIQFFLRKV